MSDEAMRMARAGEAKKALDLIAPYFDACRSDYVTGLADLAAKPMSDTIRAGIEKLAVAIKVLDEVKAQVAAAVADGGLAEHDAKRASDMANLSTEKGRWARW